MKKFIWKILNQACVIFSVIVALYSVVAMIVNVNDDRILLDAGRVLLFFLFSLLFAIANGILKQKSIPSGARLPIHFLISALAFYMCFLLPLNMPGTTVLIGMFFFILLYFLTAAVIAAFLSSFRKKKEKTEDYQKQYKNKKKND